MTSHTTIAAPLPAWADSDLARSLIAEILAKRPDEPIQNEFEAPSYPGRAYRQLESIWTEWFFANTTFSDEQIRAAETPFKLITRLLADERFIDASVASMGNGWMRVVPS